ncbi:MAG: transcriptional regulator NrdR [Candidatus Micrarchaeia archaeon]
MRCPYCRSTNISVIDSRDVTADNSIRRRRICNSCKRRFTTYERIYEAEITVIKKNGDREPFDKGKVLNGIMKACEKRPIDRGRMEEIANRVERKLVASGKKEVTSRRIGDMVVNELFKVDPVAYIRFASVYNNFDSPEEFRRVALFMKKSNSKNKR